MAFATPERLVGAVAPASLQAQEIDPTSRSEWPEADPVDVQSPDAIVEAAYHAISEPAGEKRNIDRFRSLFRPDARLIPTGREDGAPPLEASTVEEYIEEVNWQDVRKRGFFEREIVSEIDRFGDIDHVLSTYASYEWVEASEPIERGGNRFQLWHDGDRWWIVIIFWHAERDGAPIPDRYLDGARNSFVLPSRGPLEGPCVNPASDCAVDPTVPR